DVNPFGGGNPLLTKEAESEPIIWDIGDEEEKYPFVNEYLSFKEELIMFLEDESCPIYDTDNEEEELMSVYDTDTEDVDVEEEDGDKGEVIYDIDGNDVDQSLEFEPLQPDQEIAYQCFEDTQAKCPTIEVVIKELEKAIRFQKSNKDSIYISLENKSQIKEDLSSLSIRLFHYIKETHRMLEAFEFLSNVNKLQMESGEEDAPVLHHVEGAFVDTILAKEKTPPQDNLLKIEKDQSFRKSSQESSLFIFKLGMSKLECSFLMNGLINSRTDILDKFLSKSGIQRYNPQIVGDKAKPKFVSLTASIVVDESLLSNIEYLHFVGTIDDLKPITHLLVVDVTFRKGVQLLQEGIRYLMPGYVSARVGFLFNSNLNSDSNSFILMKALEITASSFSHKKKILELANASGIQSKGFMAALSEISVSKFTIHLKKTGQFLHGQVGLEKGVNAVITNGRVVHVPEAVTFLSQDLHLLEYVELKQRVKHVANIIEEVTWENVDPDTLISKFMSDIIMSATSSLSTRDRISEGACFKMLSADYSGVILGSENSTIHTDAVIDPLSSSGQKISSLLRIIQKCSQPSMRLVFNPLSSLMDLPQKNYYIFVVPSEDDFSNTDSTVHGPKAFFANMPLSKTLTLNLDVPESWLVEPVIAVHDLDNILLENLGDTRTLQAVFELEALVLTGKAGSVRWF
ncbi:UDP-glucose:glycoprotein glucosyltransferase, partial [Tanacetum coccineum]